MDRIKTILRENGNHLLVRINSVNEIGNKKYSLVSYEIWSDREKFNANIQVEYTDSEQHIYCSNYATTDEGSMISAFERICEQRQSV